MATPTTGYSVAIRQGHLFRVLPQQQLPRQHAGGGKRGRQHGHNDRAARELRKFLLARPVPSRVVWLTFAEAVGPDKVKKLAKAFLMRIERRLKKKVPAVIKMELQQCLSPELGILLWEKLPGKLDTAALQTLWEETIGGTGRVEVEAARNWEDLASYVSKTVKIGPDTVAVGNNSFLLSKKDKTDTSSPEATERHAALVADWQDYAGHFSWKHRVKLIPKAPVKKAMLSESEDKALRAGINVKRRRHYVGTVEGFSMSLSMANKICGQLPDALLYRNERSSRR